MWHTIILVFGALILAAGIILVYDARVISNRTFSFGDQNEASLGLKMIGFIVALIGALIIISNT